VKVGEIIPCFGSSIVVHRATGGTSYVDGVAQVVSVETFTLDGVSVQPATGQDRELVPELVRDREIIKLFTECELKGVDVERKVRADRLDVNGQEYVVETVKDWSCEGGFWKVLAIKEND
jgi:hypothetical protein